MDAPIKWRRGLQQGIDQWSSVAELDFDDPTAIKAARLARDGESPRHADQIGVPRVMFSGEV